MVGMLEGRAEGVKAMMEKLEKRIEKEEEALHEFILERDRQQGIMETNLGAFREIRDSGFLEEISRTFPSAKVCDAYCFGPKREGHVSLAVSDRGFWDVAEVEVRHYGENTCLHEVHTMTKGIQGECIDAIHAKIEWHHGIPRIDYKCPEEALGRMAGLGIPMRMILDALEGEIPEELLAAIKQAAREIIAKHHKDTIL